MNLLEGVILLDENGKNIISNKIYKSQGTVVSKQKKYLEKSYVPKGKWLKISSEDMSTLSFKNANLLDAGSFISLLKVPQDVTSSFEEIRNEIRKGVSEEEVQDYISEFRSNKKNITPIIQYIDGLGKNNGQILIGTNKPGLNTVTYDPNDNEKRFIGLHLDNWFQKKLSERFFSPRRICMNLGISTRYLLFINLPLNKIVEVLKRQGVLTHEKIIPSTSLGHLFMEFFPTYPVTRLEIQPNEAYIASTENIIHDGSTLLQSNLDLCLHSHGLFYP